MSGDKLRDERFPIDRTIKRPHHFERSTSLHYPCRYCGQDGLGLHTVDCPGELDDGDPHPGHDVPDDDDETSASDPTNEERTKPR